MQDGEAAVSSVTVDSSAYVRQSDDYGEATPVAVTMQGRRLLIAGSSTSVGGKSYDVYVVEDVSDVYDRISRMAWIFAGVSIAAITLGAVVVMLLVRRSTKPITALSGAAKEIADGAYEKRVTICTKDEIGTLGEDFNRMADAVETKISELEERNERQRLFIGGVTHEFKTPIGAFSDALSVFRMENQLVMYGYHREILLNALSSDIILFASRSLPRFPTRLRSPMM